MAPDTGGEKLQIVIIRSAVDDDGEGDEVGTQSSTMHKSDAYRGEHHVDPLRLRAARAHHAR